LTRFQHPIEYIPILNRQRRIVGIARQRRSSDGIQIGDVSISETSPTFIIAEIGINHNGSFELARRLIDHAVAAGADCAKFQMRNLQTLYRNAGNPDDAHEDLGAQYTLDLLSRFQLSPDEMFAAFDYCKAQGILPLCTPWDAESFSLLDEYGMEAYKIASPDLTNHDLIKMVARSGKPLLCSTGMSTETEILESVKLLNTIGAKYVLLHCNSTYPAPFKDVNLNYLSHLKEIGRCPVGYSGHERGIYVAIAAVVKGAKVIEKHLTLDKTMEGNDHKVSLLPDEFAEMVQGIRQVEEALGRRTERSVSQGEMMNRTTWLKAGLYNRSESGDVITAAAVTIKSRARLTAKSKGRSHRIKSQTPLFAPVISFFPATWAGSRSNAKYNFSTSWGDAGAYHDFQAIGQNDPDFLEFHLSYKDLDQDVYHMSIESSTWICCT
jgi:N-acetylneuraminate synthase